MRTPETICRTLDAAQVESLQQRFDNLMLGETLRIVVWALNDLDSEELRKFNRGLRLRWKRSKH